MRPLQLRTSTLGNAIVAAGALVGASAVAAIALDYTPTLSPEMINLLFFKGLGAGAVGLIIVGSWVARHGRNEARSISAAGTARPRSGSPLSQHEQTEALPAPPPGVLIEDSPEVGGEMVPAVRHGGS